MQQEQQFDLNNPFKSSELNRISKECGLHIDPNNIPVTYAEIEFFVSEIVRNIEQDINNAFY